MGLVNSMKFHFKSKVNLIDTNYYYLFDLVACLIIKFLDYLYEVYSLFDFINFSGFVVSIDCLLVTITKSHCFDFVYFRGL